MLKWYVQARLKVESWFDGVRREDGAVSIEYVGLASVVVAIIVALAGRAGAFGDAMADGIDKAIQSVLGAGK